MENQGLTGKNRLTMRLAGYWRSVASFREATIMMIILLLGILMSILSPHFLTADNLMSTAIGFSADGIITVGMTIALVSGGFDFSVGSVTSLSSITAGVLYLNGTNIWVACIVALLVGMLCGLVNGFFIGKIGLSPFITTIAMMEIARGASFVLNQGAPISMYGVSNAFTFLGQGNVLGIPIIVAVFVVISVIGDFMLRRSEPMRKVFYVGSNEKTAILAGINTFKVKMGVYVFVALLASIAGILTLARFNVAAPTTGIGVDASIRSIAAAVIGGASLSGGEGTILGSILGLILLNLINNGMILLNVPVYWQDLVNGLILITAVTIDFISHKNRMNRYKLRNLS